MYRPPSPRFGDGESSEKKVELLIDAHRLAGVVLVLAAAVVVAALVKVSLDARAGSTGLAAALAVSVIIVPAWASGDDLAWQQLALVAVTVGDGVSGIWDVVFDDRVRFVLRCDVEISTGAYQRDVALHMLLYPLVLVAAGIGAWRVARTHDDEDAPTVAGRDPDH